MNEVSLVNTALNRALPTLDKFPQPLIDQTMELLMQSRTKINNLRPEEEPARHALCAHLAIEKLMTKLSLPTPTIKQAPVPQKLFLRLIDIFRSELFPAGFESPLKTPSLKRTAAISAEAKFSPVPFNERLRLLSARSPRKGSSLSPTKRSPTKKERDPEKHDITRLCEALSLSEESQGAVEYGYIQYRNLAKDKWGLLCGLIYVIVSKAQPELIQEKSRNRFEFKIVQLAPAHITDDKISEWISWADKIAGDQPWLQKLAVRDSVAIGGGPTEKKRKQASGIGNMVTASFSFCNPQRVKAQREWEREIMAQVEQAIHKS
ncbi:hypothetical protein TRVA0_065S00584 [Trichomonascus vanleenenianus]|uniref:uncharacterized protein n=1 Tax=Trichomonascus vanleenenianus TaxID=2268995 RepID=UPI003ECB591D